MQAYKPGSVHAKWRDLIIYLGPASPQVSNDLPTICFIEKRTSSPLRQRRKIVYLIFQPVRFTLPLLSPTRR